MYQLNSNSADSKKSDNRNLYQMMMKKILSTALVGFSLLTTAWAEPKTFSPDPAHSGVSFEIRYFFTPINGSFGEFDATIVHDEEDPSKSTVSATIKVETIDTNNDDRDEHLRNEDFFHISENPEISFESTSWTKKGDNQYLVEGNLSMAGQTKPVTLNVSLLGTRVDEGVVVAGWEATTTLDRRDWGIDYGQGVVGNEVTVEIFMEAPEA